MEGISAGAVAGVSTQVSHLVSVLRELRQLTLTFAHQWGPPAVYLIVKV